MKKSFMLLLVIAAQLSACFICYKAVEKGTPPTALHLLASLVCLGIWVFSAYYFALHANLYWVLGELLFWALILLAFLSSTADDTLILAILAAIAGLGSLYGLRLWIVLPPDRVFATVSVALVCALMITAAFVGLLIKRKAHRGSL